MRASLLALLLLTLPTLTFAHEKGDLKKRTQTTKPHEHGAGKMDIAFDGLNGELHFAISAEAIFGTEAPPKGKDERNKETLSLNNLIQNVQEWVKIDGADCDWDDVKAQVERHKVGKTQHADIAVKGKVSCKKPIIGATLKVELMKSYPGIKRINLQVVADGIQKGAEITSSNMSIVL